MQAPALAVLLVLRLPQVDVLGVPGGAFRDDLAGPDVLLDRLSVAVDVLAIPIAVDVLAVSISVVVAGNRGLVCGPVAAAGYGHRNDLTLTFVGEALALCRDAAPLTATHSAPAQDVDEHPKPPGADQRGGDGHQERRRRVRRPDLVEGLEINLPVVRYPDVDADRDRGS